MLSKNKIKLIQSLKSKKNRNKLGLFVVEGEKSVSEFLKNKIYELDTVFYTKDYSGNPSLDNHFLIREDALKKISFLKTPQKVLAVFKKNSKKKLLKSNLTLALDTIQDPGNLGTIIRLCDWFGVTEIICSENTVDCYNPKVVQATMGSLNRVTVKYLDLQQYLTKTTKMIYAADMVGENVYQTNLNNQAVLVMGNEANGISDTIMELVSKKVRIPRFGNLQKTESLNVATATGILLSEFKRKEFLV